MMSMQTKLEHIGAELKSVAQNTYHYWRPKMAVPYLVWQEQSEAENFNANNHKQEQVLECSADYYTKTEYDTAVDAIQSVFDSHGASWRLNSVQYEEDTELIHFEWFFEV